MELRCCVFEKDHFSQKPGVKHQHTGLVRSVGKVSHRTLVQTFALRLPGVTEEAAAEAEAGVHTRTHTAPGSAAEAAAGVHTCTHTHTWECC